MCISLYFKVDILEQKLLAGNTRTKELVDEQKKLQDMVAECRANVSAFLTIITSTEISASHFSLICRCRYLNLHGP